MGYYTFDCKMVSDMGRRLNTTCMSGLEPFNLDFMSMREPTAWERRLMRGRMIFYRSTPEELANRASVALGIHWTPGVAIPTPDTPRYVKVGAGARRVWTPSEIAKDLAEVVLAHQNAQEWTLSDKVFADHFDAAHQIADGAESLPAATFRSLYKAVETAATLGDALSTEHEEAVRTIHEHHAAATAALSTDGFGGDSTARSLVRRILGGNWRPAESLELFCAYCSEVRVIERILDDGFATPALVNRLAFIARMDRVDPPEATRLMVEVLQLARVRD